MFGVGTCGRMNVVYIIELECPIYTYSYDKKKRHTINYIDILLVDLLS